MTTMGILDIFKKKVKFIDDVFGSLDYTTFKDSSKNFYSGMVQFQENLIGINLDADENGPTLAQKDFFLMLSANYNEIKENIILPFLKQELEDSIEKSGLNNFDNEFKLDGISIGCFKKSNSEWSITYDSKLMRHYVSIDFEGINPKYISIDG